MTRYILWRLAGTIPLLLVISIFVFILVQLAPGDAASALTGGRPTSTEALAALRAKYHLDEPLPVQYWLWLRDAVQFDFGTSIQTRQPVTQAIAARLGLSLWLTLYASVIVLALGIPLLPPTQGMSRR